MSQSIWMVNIAVGCSPSLSNDELIDRIQRALDSEFNDDSFAVVKNSSIVDGPEKVFLTMIHNKENKNV